MSTKSRTLTKSKKSFIFSSEDLAADAHRLTRIIQKSFESRLRWKSDAGAEGAALDGGDGVAQFQPRFEIFAGEQSVEKAIVKCVAGAGRVATPAGRCEARRFDKSSINVDNSAGSSDRHAGYRATIAGF